MSMIFECNDLSQASPATVSRCGMIYLEPSSLGWRPVLASWLNTLPALLNAEEKFITALFEWVCPPLLYFVRKNCKVAVIYLFYNTTYIYFYIWNNSQISCSWQLRLCFCAPSNTRIIRLAVTILFDTANLKYTNSFFLFFYAGVHSNVRHQFDSFCDGFCGSHDERHHRRWEKVHQNLACGMFRLFHCYPFVWLSFECMKFIIGLDIIYLSKGLSKLISTLIH